MIAEKELLPVVLAAALWGAGRSGAPVLLRSDNTTVVSAVATGSSRDSPVMPLLRTLQFYAAHFGFSWRARHLPGISNTLADLISRNGSREQVLTMAP